MIEKAIKKLLRKWLKKKVYRDISLASNVARFEWVYNSPLHEWRDRIWVVNNCPCVEKEGCDEYFEYIYK